MLRKERGKVQFWKEGKMKSGKARRFIVDMGWDARPHRLRASNSCLGVTNGARLPVCPCARVLVCSCGDNSVKLEQFQGSAAMSQVMDSHPWVSHSNGRRHHSLTWNSMLQLQTISTGGQ